MTPEDALHYSAWRSISCSIIPIYEGMLPVLLRRNAACDWVPWLGLRELDMCRAGRSDAIAIATDDAHHGGSKH